MFDNEQLGPEVLSNPSVVQNMILTEFQNRYNGQYSVADPNNAFCFILEAGSSILAQFVRQTESRFEALYPVRAVDAAELYPHMSDFDYLNLTASPAPCVFRLIFDRDWLSANAVPYDTNYNQVVIPATTVINLGGRSFGLYYPINILINRVTGSILATWDLSVPNPLFTMDSNFLNDVTEYTYGGINFLALTFTAYQFAVQTQTDVATTGTGFNKSYSYTDQFYAARVFTQINGVWQELAYTLSQTIYDPTNPTAVLTILPDTQTLQVQIPQVYFTQNQIGQSVMVQLYTTQGALNVAIAQTDAQQVTANFDINSSPYATILANPPTLILTPYEQTQITGGGNGMSFAQLRQAIIDNTLYSQVPITPLELDAAATKLGLSLTKYLDNITDRIYFASSQLINAANQRLVPIGMLATYFDLTAISTTATILSYGDNSTTVLPTTLFQFDPNNNLCTPLTDAQVQYLASQTSQQLAATLNTTTYTRQPYHLVIYSDPKYPAANAFDLTAPSVNNLTFVAENAASAVQLTVASVGITHLANGTGGYQLSIGVKRSQSLQGADPSIFYVVVSVQDRIGTPMQLRATYSTSTSLLDLYTVAIPTDYHITSDNYIRTTLNTEAGLSTLSDIPLSSTFTFYLGVSGAANPTVPYSQALQPATPSAYTDMVTVSQQSATVTFGVNLSTNMYNIVTSNWGPQPYAQYPQTVYYTYQHDVYETNANNELVYTIATVNNVPTVQLTKIHSAGDQVLDANGNPVVQYAAGSLQLDANGNPIPLANRTVVYTIQMLQLDARLYSSTDPNDVNFITGFSQVLNAALANVSTLQANLLERTALYYKPARTIGLATFGIGGGKTTQLPLNLSFALTFYVSDAVLSDPVQTDLITTTTQTTIMQAVTEPVISLTAISTTLQQLFGTKVSAIDIGGINGDPTLQTLSLIDTDAVPSVGLNLVVNSDGSLSLQPAISITFVLSPTS